MIDISSSFRCSQLTSDDQVTYMFKVSSTSDYVKDLDSKRNDSALTVGYANVACNDKISWIHMVSDRLRTDTGYVDALLHELGHTLGIGHNNTEYGTIMYPSIDKSSHCITQIDVENFCSKWGCSIQI